MQATEASDDAPLESRAMTSMQVRALIGVTVALVCLVSWTGSSWPGSEMRYRKTTSPPLES